MRNSKKGCYFVCVLSVVIILVFVCVFIISPTWAENPDSQGAEIDGYYPYKLIFGATSGLVGGMETKSHNPNPVPTFKTNDPILAGGGEFRQYWQLLSLGGPMELNFTLIYAPDLQFKSPLNDGRVQFPPGGNNDAFTTNTIFRMGNWGRVQIYFAVQEAAKKGKVGS